MKKIVITIKEKDEDSGDCSVNIKMEKSKTETKNEVVTASTVYQQLLGKLEELSKIK